jgi:pyrroloquinoline quinone biosynthesis protein B
MRVHILGSAAGGGFPQWNCGCDNCRDVRKGVPGLRARSQESVAVSSDGEHWFLLNASPEVRAQIESFSGLHPRERRHSPIAGIVLTNGDLDHCLGLLSLRESHPLRLITTRAIESGFREQNVLFRTLQRFPEQLRFQPLQLGQPEVLLDAAGKPSGLTLEAVPVPGKLPIHLEGRGDSSPEDNIGLLIHDGRQRQTLGYFPAVARGSDALHAAASRANVLMFDGTFWSEDELSDQGLSTKHAKDMAHWPVGGDAGSARYLQTLPASRKLLIHINNTNPMLRQSSAEAAHLAASNIEVTYDGMELTL